MRATRIRGSLERLGHGTVQIALDRYSHVAGNLQREAAAALDVVLGAPNCSQ
ncbi:MAG: hypothetical protein IT337_16820 [Thermomicrobiales bacterium]|nr:hypothetical protein [Thermomicrobiales bacterium]